MGPEDAVEARAQADVDLSPLVDSAAKGYTVELAGRDRLPGGDTWRLVVRGQDGPPRTMHLDARTHLVVQTKESRDLDGEVVEFVTEVGERAGQRIGLAGVRLKVDPERAQRLAVTVRLGPLDAISAGVRKTVELSGFTLRMLGRIVTGEASVKNISGPITMADFAGQSAQAGTLVFVGYLALISISLGVLNLLPVPLLDGGHLLYYFVEVIKGSPVSDRAFEVGQRIGMAVLAMLMTLALFNDLSRLF